MRDCDLEPDCDSEYQSPRERELENTLAEVDENVLKLLMMMYGDKPYKTEYVESAIEELCSTLGLKFPGDKKFMQGRI